MKAYNTAMSAVRSSVEWLFGDIINYFKFLDFKKNLKIGLSSIGKMYIVSALLQNALTCLYGNETATSFYFLTHQHWKSISHEIFICLLFICS